jgi:hypothetical protein
MAEITQPENRSSTVPPMWNGHPVADLVLLYKKTAYRVGTNVKNAIMENPARNIPLAIGLTVGVGSAERQARAGLASVINGKSVEKLTKDPNYVAKVANDLSQSATLGIFRDVMNAATHKQGFLDMAIGPVVSDANKVVQGAGSAGYYEGRMLTGTGKTYQNKNLRNDSLRELGKFGAGSVPIFGSEISKKYLTKKPSRGGGSGYSRNY